ncbi:MAG: hypothetical protein J6S00_06270, partial [Clostridia bacterium]|nr:hypothetical protein [Clostridia bacterium]
MSQQLQIFNVPYFAPCSKDYYVEINGKPICVHSFTVSSKPTNEMWRGVQRTENECEQASLINFNFSGRVTIRVVCAWEIFNAHILPETKNVSITKGAKNKGDEVSFTITEPGQYVLEINGLHSPLHILANPIEEYAPDPLSHNVDYRQVDEKQNFPGPYNNNPRYIAEGKNLIYFGPGIHHVDKLIVKSNQSVYIHGGAVVYGTIFAENAENIHIFGRGILDGSRFNRDYTLSGLSTLILLHNCKNVKVEGIILRNSVVYQLATSGGTDIEISNLKVFSWRRNSDGLDFHNTSNLHIHDCFVRAFDDAIVLKGQQAYMGYPTGNGAIENALIERCIIWGDWGRALEIGAETSAPAIRNIIFRDCDILHFAFVACDIQACGSAPISNIVFDNIRIGNPIDALIEPRIIEIFIRSMVWMQGEPLGSVNNITYRNIIYNGLTICPCRFIGASAEHNISNIYLES